MDPIPTPPKKILLADDDVYISRAYTFGLTKAGFVVVTAANGKEALEIARTEHPDLILLDQIMPIMNGFEVLEVLRSDPELKHIPVVLCTNLEQSSDEEKGKSLGAIDYLVKAELTIKDVVAKAERYTRREGRG